MKFYISQSDWDLDREKSIKKIIKDYPCLKDYGFELEEIKSKYTRGKVTDDEGNELKIEHYESVFKPYITIDNLEQLMKLIQDVGVEIIINDGYIEIYDAYRE